VAGIDKSGYSGQKIGLKFVYPGPKGGELIVSAPVNQRTWENCGN
jgi:hypothetical protein